jgi:hypothetical protein
VDVPSPPSHSLAPTAVLMGGGVGQQFALTERAIVATISELMHILYICNLVC